MGTFPKKWHSGLRLLLLRIFSRGVTLEYHLKSLCLMYQQHTILVLKTLKNLHGPFLWMGFNCLKARATLRKYFTFYHSVLRNAWYWFSWPRMKLWKTESTLEPPSCFECGTLGLGTHHLNQQFDLRFIWNFKISCKSKIKLLQINVPCDVSDKYHSDDIEGWPLRIINISKFRVFYYFVLFYEKYSFCSLFQ